MALSKPLKIIFAGLCGLIAGLALFFPWDAAAEYAASRAAAAASEKNIFLSFQNIFTEGLLDREFICRGFTADMPAVSIKISEARVDPMFIRSLISASKTGTLSFGRGEITTVTKQKLKWTSGTANVKSTGDTLYVDDITLDGDVSAKGFINISNETGKIVNADITARFPDEFDRALQMLSNLQVLPLTKISSGEWRITR
ncbi:MAG: type II secretion system protein GspN [Synergistaceae bacterium]|nr:type II secretion system protein GspN [Synergistaceae bacterium]